MFSGAAAAQSPGVPPFYPVSQVSVGNFHLCATTGGGAAYCWGENIDGQLGDGGGGRAVPEDSAIERPASKHQSLPVLVKGLDAGVRSVAAGRAHSCALMISGEVRCWGDNSNFQLGVAQPARSDVPVTVAGLGTGLRTIAARDDYTCVVASNGAMSCWGAIGGVDATSPATTVLFSADVEEMGLGTSYLCARTATGNVGCRGYGAGSPVASGGYSYPATNVAKLAAGSRFLCLLSTQGAVRCGGQMFFETTDVRWLFDFSLFSLPQNEFELAFRRDLGPLANAAPMPGLASGVRSITAGDTHFCATLDSGLKCYGFNYLGQIGSGRANKFEELTTVSTTVPTAVAAGRGNTCALQAGGALQCWGLDANGQSGDGDLDRVTPETVIGLDSGVRDIAVGSLFSCALTDAGRVYCWGRITYDSTAGSALSIAPRPVEIVGFPGAVQSITAGLRYACAQTSAGSVCWGDDLRLTPSPAVQSPGPAIPTQHLCGVDPQAGVVCRGANERGQLGNGSRVTPNNSTTFFPVSGLGDGALDGGDGLVHSCAITRTRGAKCWGDSSFGQVGSGKGLFKTLPDAVVDPTPDRQVDASPTRPDAPASQAAIDAIGRYVVFQSQAGNLVAGDSNGASDVFLRDRQTDAVVRVSVDDAGAQIAGASTEPSMSADGKLVVFVAPDAAAGKLLGESKAAREARLKSNHYAVLMRNLVTGTTQRVATAVAGGAGTTPQVAPGGTAVVYTTNPTAAQGNTSQTQVFKVPLTRVGNSVTAGAPSCLSCKQVNASGSTTATNVDGSSRNPTVSADGNTIAWESDAKSPIAGTTPACPNSGAQIYLRNLVTGAMAQMARPTTTAQCGATGAASSKPAIDHAGTRVAFQTTQPLEARTTPPASDVYVVDVATGALDRVSETVDGKDANGGSRDASISGDGRLVAYTSDARNLDSREADDNAVADLYVRKLGTTEQLRLSRGVSGVQADAESSTPKLSFTGSSLAFQSAARNLLATAQTNTLSVYERANPLGVAGKLKSGVWWNPSESGWGLFVFDQGDTIAPAWFTYDTDGEPVWFLLPATPQADGSYVGDVLKIQGTPFDRIDGQASDPEQVVGRATLRFAPNDRLTFDYTINGTTQRKSMEPFPFDNRRLLCSAQAATSRAGATNYSDVWWNANESGWGLFINQIDDTLLMSWYTYDSDREPVFFIATAERQADGGFMGPIFRQRNGTPFLQIDGREPSPGADPIGTATLRFTDGETGRFTYQVGAINQSKAITRLRFGATTSRCATDFAP